MQNTTIATGLTLGSLWGGALLAVGLVNLAKPGYGKEFLRVMSSVYPGANTRRNAGRVLLGGAWGFADGFVAGLIFSSVYRAIGPGTAKALR